MAEVTKDASAENTFTDWIEKTSPSPIKYADFSIAGTWTGTITLQRTFDDGVTPKDVDTFTGNYEGSFTEWVAGVKYRIGFKTGDYTNGTAVLGIYA